MITDLFYALPDNDFAARQASDYIAATQHERFFHLARAKQARMAALGAYFSRAGLRKILISDNLRGCAFADPKVPVEYLDKDFFARADPAREKPFLDGAVVIVNNNDVDMAGYAKLYDFCDRTCFIAWDWDNHHWLDLSVFLAAHSDIYAPAHHENLYLLSRYNWLTCGPVYCACVQWSRAFLADRLVTILTTERSPEPLGKHIPYASFLFRLQVIAILQQHYPSIGFSDRTFHNRTPESRFAEWCSHELHWIVPVLNDVPIRIFDALITGGIPIVPESLRLLPPIDAIDRQHILFYGADDLLAPQKLVARGHALFQHGGRDGMVARHRFALERHHGECRMRQMLDCFFEICAGGSQETASRAIR